MYVKYLVDLMLLVGTVENKEDVGGDLVQCVIYQGVKLVHGCENMLS